MKASIDVFARRLKTARLDKGYTQLRLAEAIGRNKQAICNYENGRRYPDLLIICNIADCLDVSVDYLLGRITQEKIEYEAISEKTNLSTEAIRKLSEAYYHGYNDILSQLINTNDFLETLKYMKYVIDKKPVKFRYIDGTLTTAQLDYEKEKRGIILGTSRKERMRTLINEKFAKMVYCVLYKA